MADSLGVKLTARQMAGHQKGGVTGADVRNAYAIEHGQSAKEIDRAAKRVQRKWNPQGAEKGKRQGPKRSEIPAEVKKALGANWAQIVYGGYV